MKEYGVDWRFCPECQCIQKRKFTIVKGKELYQLGDYWEKCDHDFRPNSPKGVLENQAKELEDYGMSETLLFETARCYQSPRELFTLIHQLLRPLHPKVIMEIGTFHGGSSNIFNTLLRPQKHICIDRTFDYWMAGSLPNCIAIEGESCAPETVQRVEQMLFDHKENQMQQVDFLFIDGDHSYLGEMADYNMYSPFIRKGGAIALHDTHSIPDVGRVFAEIPGRVKIDIFSYQGIGLVIK